LYAGSCKARNQRAGEHHLSERLDRVEADLAATAATLRKSADLQVDLKNAISEVVQIQKRFAASIEQYGIAAEKRFAAAEERAVRLDKSAERLNQSIADYVASADARAKLLEESMDKLIRAITSEHSNGKTKH